MTLTCLITGSSRGIGLAIAHHLAAKGHRVILNSRSPIAPEVLAQFEGYEQPVLQATGDISQFDVAKQLVDDLYYPRRFGHAHERRRLQRGHPNQLERLLQHVPSFDPTSLEAKGRPHYQHDLRCWGYGECWPGQLCCL